MAVPLVVVVAQLATAGARSADASSGSNILWLPLGDSITWGCTGPTIQDCHGFERGSVGGTGYRIPLAMALSQPPCGGCSAKGGGWNISTMGTLKTGPPYTPEQWQYHEGHPGWTINMVDSILNKSLATSPIPPDLITIHLGTNDCNGGASTETMENRMNSLLGHILSAAPKAQVYLADVIGTGNPWNSCILAFNAEVPGIVSAWQGKGMQIHFVPMHNETGICGATNGDHNICGGHQIHPTAAGYPRMASAFAQQILQTFA